MGARLQEIRARIADGSLPWKRLFNSHIGIFGNTGSGKSNTLANPFGQFDQESEVLDTLDALAQTRRIGWGFGVRVGDAHPERDLRRQLDAIDDDTLKSAALAGLDRLEQGRAASTGAAGDAAAVAQALTTLNDTFEQVTKVEATRAHGETYGARTIVYEDCRRDIRVELGVSARSRLQPPLDLVLTSARWYCHQLAMQMRAALREAHGRSGGGTVAFISFWYAAQNLFHGDGLDVSALQQELVTRWGQILPDAGDGRRLAVSASDIREAVADSFRAADCGWRSACHQSPDVMVAASDPAAAARGDLVFVLGELHMGLNTLINHSAYHQHREPRSLLTSLRADLAGPRFIPLFSREGSRQPVRVQVVTDPGVDVEPLARVACLDRPDRQIAGNEVPSHAVTFIAFSAELSGYCRSYCADGKADGGCRGICRDKKKGLER